MIAALENEFEIEKFCKKLIINTNTMSSLDASRNNLSVHFCHSYFFPSRVNSFLLKNTPAPVNSQRLHLYPSGTDCSKGCLVTFSVFLSCRAIRPSLSPSHLPGYILNQILCPRAVALSPTFQPLFGHTLSELTYFKNIPTES